MKIFAFADAKDNIKNKLKDKSDELVYLGAKKYMKNKQNGGIKYVC